MGVRREINRDNRVKALLAISQLSALVAEKNTHIEAMTKKVEYDQGQLANCKKQYNQKVDELTICNNKQSSLKPWATIGKVSTGIVVVSAAVVGIVVVADSFSK